MLNLDSYLEKITAKFLDGTCTHHGLPAGGILLTSCIQTVSSAIFFVVFMLTSSSRVRNQQLDPQAAAIGPVCLAGFAQVLQHVFGTHDGIVLVSRLRRCGTAFKATGCGLRMQAAVNTVWCTGPSTMSNGRPCQLQSGASSVTPRPVLLL